MAPTRKKPIILAKKKWISTKIQTQCLEQAITSLVSALTGVGRVGRSLIFEMLVRWHHLNFALWRMAKFKIRTRRLTSSLNWGECVAAIRTRHRVGTNLEHYLGMRNTSLVVGMEPVGVQSRELQRTVACQSRPSRIGYPSLYEQC